MEAFLTSPRACGKRSDCIADAIRVRGEALHPLHLLHMRVGAPLTPTLSP